MQSSLLVIVLSDSKIWLAKLKAQDIWTRMQFLMKPALVSHQLRVASPLHQYAGEHER